MLLLMVAERLVGKRFGDETKLIPFATNLSLADAILRFGKYEKAYANRYRVDGKASMTVTLRVLSVSEIPDLDQETMEVGHIEFVEGLDMSETSD